MFALDMQVVQFKSVQLLIEIRPCALSPQKASVLNFKRG